MSVKDEIAGLEMALRLLQSERESIRQSREVTDITSELRVVDRLEMAIRLRLNVAKGLRSPQFYTKLQEMLDTVDKETT